MTATGIDGIVTAALLVIGDEILSGRTKDKNIGHIADHLTAIGIQLKEVRVVPDEEAEIVAAVNALRDALRPTSSPPAASAPPTTTSPPMPSPRRSASASTWTSGRSRPMRAYFERRGVELTPARLRMARIPFGAELVENSVSIAPGFMLGNVIVMAGIPSIMHVMLDAATKFLKTGKKMLSAAHRPAPARGRDRRACSRRCRSAIPTCRWAATRSIRDGKPGTQLVLRSTDAARLAEAENELKVQLAARGWL